MGSSQALPPLTRAGRLQQARQALAVLEAEEWRERHRLNALETHERRVRSELSAICSRNDAVRALRTRLDDLLRERNEVVRHKTQQREVVRGVRERLRAARRDCEGLEHRYLELQSMIRRDEQTVARWQRQIKEAEEQLTRWERLLAEAQARLEEARREYAELAGYGGAPS